MSDVRNNCKLYNVCDKSIYCVWKHRNVSKIQRHILAPHHPHTTQYTAHINFLYNCFLRFHKQPEDGYCFKAETCSCILGSM